MTNQTIKTLKIKLERFDIKLVIAITGAIIRTSRKRLCDELGLKERRWYSKLTCFYKIVHELLPDYPQSYIEASFQGNYLSDQYQQDS